MSEEDDPFAVCPAGKEAETFHERICIGLMDTYSELSDREQEILSTPPANREPDEEVFLTLCQNVQTGIERLQDPNLTYDHKYELAKEIREMLSEMELT
ncbi:MAG: hypothetical protein HQL72_13385 [Magnetococcales bacterium]|nr:hypothetical protein [Magnetococcales bacterium]